jgi:DNA mismatch repair protein MutS2
MVEHLRLRVRAEVTAINKDGTLALRAGSMKLNARQEEVRVVENTISAGKSKPKAREPRQTVHTFNPAAAPMELDLRGMESLEALAAVDMFLDNALRSKLETVRIIHGKGTGVLRRAVRDHLKRSKYVKQFRPGIYGEGEDGVTIAEFR